MARNLTIDGGTTTTLAAASKTPVGGTLSTRGASYVRFVALNAGANPITAVDVVRSPFSGGPAVSDAAMNTAIAALLPLATGGSIDIEYARPIGDSLEVNITSNLGTDVQWGFYLHNQNPQSGPVS